MSRAPGNSVAQPANRTYLIIGLSAVIVMALSLMDRVTGLWVLLPTIIGAAGLLFMWTNAPLFALLGITVALLTGSSFFQMRDMASDIIFAGSVTAYLLSHYRLLSLMRFVFPPDTRTELSSERVHHRLPEWLLMLMAFLIVPYLIYRHKRGPVVRSAKAKPIEEPRIVKEINADEVVKSLAIIGAAAASSVCTWTLTEYWPAPLRIIREQWQLLLVGWFVVAPVFVVWIVVGYQSARNWSPTEGRLWLQESFWRETRREMRRVGRWIAWARYRRHHTPSEGGEK